MSLAWPSSTSDGSCINAGFPFSIVVVLLQTMWPALDVRDMKYAPGFGTLHQTLEDRSHLTKPRVEPYMTDLS